MHQGRITLPPQSAIPSHCSGVGDPAIRRAATAAELKQGWSKRLWHRWRLKPGRQGVARSKRGRKKIVDSAGHFCPNPNCWYHENADAKTHALASNGRHGRQRSGHGCVRRVAAGSYVSERHDTVMSNLKKHPDDVAHTLEMLNRGASQADVAAHHRHTHRTARRWLKRVAVQSLRIHDRYFRNLELGNVQLDELVGFIKDAAAPPCRRAASRHFIWTAMPQVPWGMRPPKSSRFGMSEVANFKMPKSLFIN